MSTRYGRLKQLDPVGPSGEALLDYGIFDAVRAGFTRVVLVVRPEIEAAVRDHCAPRWGAVMSVYAHQTLDQVPEGFTVPADRTKPWGTAHAVLAAETAVQGPFAVSNADDFYGTAAYRALASHLASGGDEHAMVGYRLDATLSAHGGVSRGLCTVAEGRLRGMAEVHDIRRGPDGVLRGRTLDGRERVCDPAAMVSMNLWGFRPAVFPLLRGAFGEFLASQGADRKAEFLVSEAAGSLVAADRVRLRVLSVDAPWMGVTFPEDRDGVVRRLREAVASGEYPADLRIERAERERA